MVTYRATFVLVDARFGSQGDEIRDDQFLPLRDRNADVPYEEPVVRCRSWLECPLEDQKAVIR